MENYYDEICGFAWLLLITKKANDDLRDWAEIIEQNILANKLSSRVAILVRQTKEYIDTETFRIGTLDFDFPFKEVWTTAKPVSEGLCDTLIALT